MKKPIIPVILISVMIISMLLAGCSPTQDTPEKKAEKYSGFMELKAGQWSETVLKTSQGTVKMRVELIENSPDLAKYQVITGEEEISQIWYDKKKGYAVMYLVESGSEILCMDADQAPMTYIMSDDSGYPADKPGIGTGIYKTGSGKEIAVAKFIGETNEVWVSSEVPFGIVKMIKDGQTTLQLYDFGTIGAKNLIDPAEAEHCSQMPILDGYVSERVYDSMNDDSALLTADEHDYEGYIEEETASDDPNIDARTYDPSGSDVDFACAECDGMPPMAKNACLAACQRPD